MSNPIWGKIRIGGEVPEEFIPDIEKKLVLDLYGSGSSQKIDFYEHIIGDLDYFEYGDEGVGEFNALESYLKEHKIPFIRDIGAYDDCQPEMRVFIPGAIDFNYLLSLSGDIIASGSDVMGLHEAVKTVTFENAALHINSVRPTVQEYATFLLAGGDPMDFVKRSLDESTPPRVPDLPVLKIIKTKTKRKKK